MSRPHALAEHTVFDAKTAGDLVAMLNQSLVDTLDLACQTKQAHWKVRGQNFFDLHLLLDELHHQLSTFGDAFAERVKALGGHAQGALPAAERPSCLDEYPMDAQDSQIHLDALVDRYGEFTGRIRTAIRKAEKLGDPATAELYRAVSRALDQALWMLTAQYVA